MLICWAIQIFCREVKPNFDRFRKKIVVPIELTLFFGGNFAGIQFFHQLFLKIFIHKTLLILPSG